MRKYNIDKETLKKFGYIKTDLYTQKEYETGNVDELGFAEHDYNYVFIYTNGDNFIFENGETLSEEEIESFNKMILNDYQNGFVKKNNLFEPFITKSKEVEIPTNKIMLKNSEIKDVVEINEYNVKTTDGKIYSRSSIEFI